MNPLLKTFVNSPVWAWLLERWFLPPLFAALPASPRRILEIGCGRGDTTRMLLKLFPDAAVVATDYDPGQVALAAKRVASGRLEIRRADATALPFPDAAFDLVIECNTFHHVAAWADALAECSRVLRPGGAFAAMDEDKALFNPLFRAIDRPESLFSKDEFRRAAESAGLSLEKDVGTRRVIRFVFAKK
ncbi:MAG: hypothetical protein RL272_1061 [Candidatus Parcubacteria bacterium]